MRRDVIAEVMCESSLCSIVAIMRFGLDFLSFSDQGKKVFSVFNINVYCLWLMENTYVANKI
jgi:hypothetical protein